MMLISREYYIIAKGKHLVNDLFTICAAADDADMRES